MKKNHLIFATVTLLLGGFTATRVLADVDRSVPVEMNSSPTNTAPAFGPGQGDWEFTVGGAGSSDQDFDNSLGGVSGSVGYFLSDTLEVALRQTISFSDNSGSGADYDGSTFVALDHHFGTERLRPFVGVNAGRLYGDTTNNTWAAGIEGGLKYYLKTDTFLYGIVNYAWAFEEADNPSDNFDDGAFLWSLGVGFSF
ncbi:MAG: hypothetical protein ACAH89_08735 [Rariglobus sp.]|nr:hypothetical protein [Rariglobus sp.]